MGCTMQGAVVKNPSAQARRASRPGKDELRSRLQGVIAEIAMHKVEDRVRVNERLKKITSLEISTVSTDTAHKKKPSIEEIIAEMEEEIARLG